MKYLKITPLIAAALGCGHILAAQVTVDFTSAEGYVEGETLFANADWAAPETSAFTVSDVVGAGTLSVDPDEGFIVAPYSAAEFTSSSYTYRAVFRLDYSEDQSANALPGGARLLGRYDIGGEGGLVGVALRQIIAGEGQYNLNLFSNLGGSNSNIYAGFLTAANLGLGVSGGSWTDPVSDRLELVQTMVYDSGSGLWTQTVTLTNLDDTAVTFSESRTFAEDDNSFLNGINTFRVNSANMHLMQGLVLKVDSLSLDADIAAVVDWAGYPIAEDGVTVDTGAFMGVLDILHEPWVWSYSLEAYIYLPEANVSDAGAWSYVPR